MAIDFKTFVAIVPHVTNVRKPVLLRGRHGVGKSEVVYQTALELGLPVVERRASQMTEGDLLGLPSTDGNVTSWNPPDWYRIACDQPVVLFLDEIDRATIEVRQGIFELTDSRKLNGHRLHPDTHIFAAVNGGEHGEQYQVGEMDPAELDRWTVFDVEPSIEDWLDWAKNKVGGLIWDFINHNHGHLEHSDDFEPNKVYPSRRSWERLSDCLESADLLKEASPTLFNLATGFVGFEAAVALNDFVANYDRQVSVGEVLNEGKIEKVKDFDINQHSAFVEKLGASGLIESGMSKDQLRNLADYFVLLPSEVAMKLWEVLGTCEQDVMEAFHKIHTSDGIQCGAHLAKLLTGKQS